MNEISVVIKKHFGVLKRMENGWTRELNLVEWNNGPAKFDIRDRSPDHTRMSRGITLTAEEIDIRLTTWHRRTQQWQLSRLRTSTTT